jgi:type III secretion system YopN/LcrE/InvE/MxiC family regulator
MSSNLEITRLQIATHNAISPVGVEVMAPLTGMRDHQRVLALSTPSQITDAAEEIGMSVAHRADRHTLGQRTIRKGQGVDLRALTRIAEFYDKLPDMPAREKLQQLVRRFQAFEHRMSGGGGQAPTRGDALALLEEFDKDVTHQYAALSLVRDFFKGRPRRRSAAGGTDIETLLDEAAGEFERTERMRDVRAGFAAAGIAHVRAPLIATDPGEIRESYRLLLRESRHFGELFDSLSRFSLGSNFDEVVDTFIEIAGSDLSASGPSTDPVILGLLLTELGKLKKLKTVHESMGKLVGDVGRGNPGSVGLLDPVHRTSLLFHYCSRTMTTLADARKLVAGLEAAGPLAPLVFANGLLALHQQVPDEVMPAAGLKLKQTSALRSLLDNLVALEEQAYRLEMETRTAARRN